MKLHFIMSILISFLFIGKISAQPSPMEFGKIPTEDLEMTTYALDPDAAAVVLGDYGSARTVFDSGEPEVTTFHHKRIKILKKSAVDEGNISIVYYSKDDYESLGRIEAQTINYKNGKKEISKLSKKDIFKEKINDNYTKVSFSFPAVEEGSIIEYKYSITQKSVLSLDPWFFQSHLPTRLSEFRFKIPEFYQYVIIVNKTKAFDDESKRGIKVNTGNMGDQVDGNQYRYVMKDMPAMVEEDYVTTMEDYLTNLQFQLSAIQFRGELRKPILTTWEKLAEKLANNQYNGRQLTEKIKHKDVAQLGINAVVGATTPEDKAAKVYSAISNAITWNGRNSFLTSDNLNKILLATSGNTADINMSLIAALRAAGLEAEPVLISTRSNGKTQRLYPLVRQFNSLIARVKIGDEMVLMDATNPDRPYDLLPRRDLNKYGLLLKKTPEWIPITPKGSNTRETVILKQGEDGNWEGELTGIYQNYPAINIRQDIKDDGKDEYLKTEFEEDAEFSAESISFENLDDPNKKLLKKLTFSGDLDEGEMIYLTPVLFGHFDESPFKQKERNYPVDFSSPYSRTYILNMTIPEGYSIEELPETVAYELSLKRGGFVFQVKDGGEFVQILSKITIKKAEFLPEDYAELKLFFEKIVEKHAEQIVLKKS